MHIVKHTIWIARTRDEVFAFFTDFSQAPRWRQYVDSMTVLDGPLRAGARVRCILTLMGERTTLDLELLAYEPTTLWRHRTNETDFFGYIEYRFETEGEGTRVTLSINARPVGLYGWLALPAMAFRRLFGGRAQPYAEQLPNLKRVLEAR
jgi:uncharacterized membrane protein